MLDEQKTKKEKQKHILIGVVGALLLICILCILAVMLFGEVDTPSDEGIIDVAAISTEAAMNSLGYLLLRLSQ